MPLYGHELTEQIDPISAGLGFACNLEGRSFIGSQAIGKIASDGPAMVRIGLLPEGKRPVREGCAVLNDRGEKVGWVTSGAPSPTLGMPIAMAMVNANVGATKADWQAAELQIDNRGNLQPATVTQLPFYQPKEPKRSE